MAVDQQHSLDHNRTGTLWTCFAHIITAVIGSGVLSLAWSTAQLGWIAGPVSMLCFAVVTYVSSSLLSDCYMSPNGRRNSTYIDAVKAILGEKQTYVCGLLQYMILFGTGIAYVITTSTSMRAIQRLNCIHEKKSEAASCAYGDSFYMLVFGAVQIFFSQIPDFHNMEWLSIVAATMSFSYSSIGFALGLAQVIAFGDETPGNLLGGIGLTQPYWLIDFANACIIVHLVGAYQVFSQPIFALVERFSAEQYPNNDFINKYYKIHVPLFPSLGIAGRLEFLAFGHIFPCEDVHCAEKDRELDKKMDSSSDFECPSSSSRPGKEKIDDFL
ncbi:hypothetical protein Scep_025443 [Stephania cephalantha]|uniref:Amino acid transporter transmembrane domain-containing protein n=1 Tax=Stephania cephalantha TaxID=152367 RepID=A0AAP0HPD2_9MAGN